MPRFGTKRRTDHPMGGQDPLVLSSDSHVVGAFPPPPSGGGGSELPKAASLHNSNSRHQVAVNSRNHK